MNILIKRGWEILWENRKVLLILNFLYYGLILALMIYGTFNSRLQNVMLDRNHATYMSGALALGQKTSLDAEVFSRLGFSYLSNLLGSSYAEISLPSYFIPFIGIFLGLYRAALLGLAFSPFNPNISPIILPHLPTMFIEGQAYILAMLGAYIHGRAMLSPSTTGQTSRWKAYVEGVRQSGTMYIFIMPILLIASCYSVLEFLLLMG